MTSTAPTTNKPPLAPPAPPPPPLLLTIRFSAALPDLDLDIPHPGATTVVSLKHLIRSRLDNTRNRLRFIHSGKILPDTAVLSSVLRVLPPPPPSAPLTSSSSNAGDHGNTDTAKGKSKGKQIPGRPEPAPRLYINCSIGDELTPSELDHEAKAAALPPPSNTSTSGSALAGSSSSGNRNRNNGRLASLQTGSSNGRGNGGNGHGAQQQAPPRGFDRLLSAGFTASEVNQLRLQFRSIHASRYTPDTLPSPDSFRRMEDAWIDDNGALSTSSSTNSNNQSAFGGVGGASGGGILGGSGTDSDEVGGLVAMVDVLIRGVITGFVWPLGSAAWLMREENMSSGRWRFMVGVGVFFSFLIGCIRAISAEK